MSDPELEVADTAAVTLTEHASVLKFEEERVVGFVESERQGVERSAADIIGGQVATQLAGSPPQGEADTLVAAAILVKRLNALGSSWGDPRPAGEPADFEAEDAVTSGRLLRVQVVRAISSGSLWRELGVTRAVGATSDVESLIAELRTSIQKKSTQYARVDQKRLVLALDANRLPAFILSDVQSKAVAQLGSACAETAFAAVWVVGPTSERSGT
jgi:hypothetical protein